MRVLVKHFRRRVYAPDSSVLDEQRHFVARCLLVDQTRLHTAKNNSKRSVVVPCLWTCYNCASWTTAINRFLFPERMCVFFSCSASYGHTPQRPHVVKVRGVFANDSNSPLRTKWVFPRSAVSDSTDIRRISSGGSYAEEEGRDGVLERNRECATSPFNYLTHKTIIYLNHVKFQSFISDVCGSVYRRRLFLTPLVFRASFTSLKACGVNNSEQET